MRPCLLSYAACIILFSSCRLERAHRYVYASQAANINYFTKKGDSKITAYYSGDGYKKDDGYNIQTAYAFSNHFAIMASYINKREHYEYRYDSFRYHQQFFGGLVQTNIFDSSVMHYRRNTFELGVGYFIPLDHKKEITYNLYAGASFGKHVIHDAGLDSNNKQYNRFYSNNPTKYFLQNNFNFLPSPIFYFSVGWKFSLLGFPSIHTTYDAGELNYFYLDKIDHKTFFLFEPFLNIQFSPLKYQWLKFDGQMSFTSRFDYEYPRVKTFNGSMGLTIEPAGIFKKGKN